MKFFSIGVSMTWQIAAGTAASLKQEHIEKEHIFIGLFSLEKLLELGPERFGLTPRSWMSLVNEQRIIENLLTRYQIDSTELRRRVRMKLTEGTFSRHQDVMHRSHECCLIFKQAEALGREKGGQHFSGLHLLAVILKNPGECISTALGELNIVPSLFQQHVLNMAGKRKVGFTRLEAADLDTMHMFASSRGSEMLIVVVDDVVVAAELESTLSETAYSQILTRHDEIVTAIVRRKKDGEIIKSTGSGLLLVFTSLQSAIESALTIQETFKKVSSFKIRIGLDMGAVLREKDSQIAEIYGTAVDNAGQIAHMSSGGHVVVSETVYDNAVGLHLPFAAWHCLGTGHLEDENQVVMFYELYDKRIPHKPLASFLKHRLDADLAALEKKLEQ